MPDFAEIFSQLRRDSGKSQRTVAQEMHISQALLSHYENGVREPRLDFVARACDYYGVSADYLLGRTDKKAGTAALTDGQLAMAACMGTAPEECAGALEDLALLLCLESGAAVDGDPLQVSAEAQLHWARALQTASGQFDTLPPEVRQQVLDAARRAARRQEEQL